MAIRPSAACINSPLGGLGAGPQLVQPVQRVAAIEVRCARVTSSLRRATGRAVGLARPAPRAAIAARGPESNRPDQPRP